MSRHDHEERGAAGIEVLPLALLCGIALVLLFAHAWGVVDATSTVEHAAREGGRAYAEARSAEVASAEAASAARAVLAGAGRDPDLLQVEITADRFQRCRAVIVEVTYPTASIASPIVGGLAGPTVRGTHRELLDAHSSDRRGPIDCG